MTRLTLKTDSGRSVRRARVEYSGADVRKDAFKKWCIPFDEGQYEVLGRIIETKDEHWQITPKWLTDHNLPMLIGAGITALLAEERFSVV
jgi:hypothetical protein